MARLTPSKDGVRIRPNRGEGAKEAAAEASRVAAKVAVAQPQNASQASREIATPTPESGGGPPKPIPMRMASGQQFGKLMAIFLTVVGIPVVGLAFAYSPIAGFLGLITGAFIVISLATGGSKASASSTLTSEDNASEYGRYMGSPEPPPELKAREERYAKLERNNDQELDVVSELWQSLPSYVPVKKGFCPHCGKTVLSEFRYCPACGERQPREV